MAAVPFITTITGTDLARWAGGRLLSGQERWRPGPIQTNSVRLVPGEVFLALKGARFDGHDFVPAAIKAGAGGLIVRRGAVELGPIPDGIAVIEVEDTLVALGALAREVRRAQGLRVVAITGSAGKTTTRSFVESILGRGGRVVATQGNLNNLIGLPLSILETGTEDRLGVFELGSNQPGEIARLAEIAEPDAAIITNIGAAHLAGLGSEHGVFEEKTALLRALSPDGLALLPAADRWLTQMVDRVGCAICRVGRDPKADFFWETTGRSRGGWRAQFHDRRGGWRGSAEIPGLAEHNVQAAAFGIALAIQWGIDPELALEGVGEVCLPRMRMELRIWNDVEWIIDCYNANPSSMRSALDVLRGLEIAGRKIAVLGDMLELGDQSDRYHDMLAGWITASGVDAVFACGDEIGRTVSALESMGWNQGRVVYRREVGELKSAVMDYIRPGDLLLLKGSRMIGLDQILPENVVSNCGAKP